MPVGSSARARMERGLLSSRYVLVCVTQKDFRPVPIPEEFRRKITRFLEPSEAAARNPA